MMIIIYLLLARGDIIGAFSALKNHKSNLTVEVSSDKLEVYRIFKGDILSLFGGITGKVPEYLKSIDNSQQVCTQIKINYLEEKILDDKWDLIKKFTFINSSSLQPSKPKHIDESQMKNVLKDAYKSLEAVKTSKINDIKSSLIPNKAKGLTGLRGLETSSVLSKANTLKGLEKQEGGLGMLNKNGIGISTKQPLKQSISSLTSSQIASQNKLNLIMGIKKPTQSQDEVNEAFKRINERKKGDGIGSKLLSGLDYSSNAVSYKTLSERLDHPDNVDNQKEKLTATNQNSNLDKITEEPELNKAFDNLKIEELNNSDMKKQYCTENIKITQEIKSLNDSKPHFNECDDEKLLRSMKKKSSKLFTKLVK